MTEVAEEKQTLIMARSGEAGMTLVRSTRDTASVLEAVSKARQAGFNVLTSATLTETLPMDCQLSIRIVQVRGERDFYSTGKNKYAPSGKMLDKIAQAGGLRWRVDLFRREDDGREPYYCRYAAVGVAPDPATGEPRMMRGTKAIDLRDGSPLCEEMLENARNSSYNKTPEAAQAAGEKAIRQKRKFINELAETGARLRVIRSLFSIDSDFSSDEIKRDFVIVSLDHIPHLSNDPAVNARHREDARQLRQAMYYGIGAQPGKPRPDEITELPEVEVKASAPRQIPAESAPDLSGMEMGPEDIPFGDDYPPLGEIPF